MDQNDSNKKALEASAKIFRMFTVVNSVIAVIFAIIALITGFTGNKTACIIMLVGVLVFGGLDLIFIHFLRKTKKDQAQK